MADVSPILAFCTRDPPQPLGALGPLVRLHRDLRGFRNRPQDQDQGRIKEPALDRALSDSGTCSF